MVPLCHSRFLVANMLGQSGMGLGAVALSSLFSEAGLLSADEEKPVFSSLAPKQPQFPAKVKRVIQSVYEWWPVSSRYVRSQNHSSKSITASNCSTESTRMTNEWVERHLPPRSNFKNGGESGIEVSELLPKISEHIDDICVIRSMVTDVPNHEPGLMMIELWQHRPIPTLSRFLDVIRTGIREPIGYPVSW